MADNSNLSRSAFGEILTALPLLSQGGYMSTKDRLKKALDSINEVLREVQRLQPSVPPLSQRVRNQLQSTTRKLKDAASEIETVMREPDLSSVSAPCVRQRTDESP